jgi:hypothetical protein
MEDHPPHFPPPLDPVDALSRIEDDETVNHEASRWAAEQLVDGNSPEALVAQLLTEGWEPHQAEQIVETARRETRQQRGVVTREDVVRDLNVDYRRATGGLSVAFRSGLFGIYGFTTGFLAALRSARKLKHILRKHPASSRPESPRTD